MLLLFREWHVVAIGIGIILTVVGLVGQRVGGAIRLSVVGEALVLIGRLDRFVIVRVCIRRSVIRMVLVIRRIWRGVVGRREIGRGRIGMARAVIAVRCGGRNECGIARLMGRCRRTGGIHSG